jgi:pre-mRNA-splicing factor CWC26
MPSDKAAYLAAHYLSADTKPSSKKRKRKQPASSGLLITEDDETGWGSSTRASAADEDDDIPVTVAGTSSEFRRTKKSGWKTLSGTSTTPNPPPKDDTAAAADAIIASAAAESRALAANDDDPDPTPTTTTTAPTPLMSNGTLAGLQSSAAITAQLRARQLAEAAELAELQAAASANPQPQSAPTPTLRDATGRRVDASLLRAEARRQAAEAARAEKAKTDLLKGEVQTAAARQRREDLEDAALMPLARRKDDVQLNEELKRQERWNDPMAEFLATQEQTSGKGGGKGKGGKIRGKRPVYTGPAAPNRYGIRPGYRWDGVDRGNGFEAERFRALNRREMNKGLEYAWQMDE